MSLLNEDVVPEGTDESTEAAGGAAPSAEPGSDRSQFQQMVASQQMDEARTMPIPVQRPAAPGPRPTTVVPSLSSFSSLFRHGLFGQAAALAAVLALVVAALLGAPLIALIATSAIVVLQYTASGNLRELRRGRGPLGIATVPRIVLACTIVVLPRFDAGAAASATLLVAATLAEPLLDKMDRSAAPIAAHLDGVVVRGRARSTLQRIPLLTSAVVLAVAWATFAGVSGWWTTPVAAVTAAVVVLAVGDAVLRIASRHRADRAVAEAVRLYGPRFAVHWDAPVGTEYQVEMWIRHLERIGERFVVVVRQARTVPTIAAITASPVIHRDDPRSLDAVVPSSLRVVFYMNNAARNMHFVRYTGLTHVQLNHGESDKAPSFSPVFRLYDKDFVAGQAAIDRFAANGVRVPRELFTIVGRPQVEGTLVRSSTSTAPTALYAPTWGGANADSDYCSLPIGFRLVEQLIARGFTVVFRPHPYTRLHPRHATEASRISQLLADDGARSGRRHRFGAEATSTMTLLDCFNAADVLVSDVSSVVPDFLYSEKPFAVASMRGTPEEFRRSFPISSAAYVIDRQGRNIDDVLAAMSGPDPLAPARLDAKRYFLGDFPEEEYGDVFVREARRLLAD